MKNNNTKQPIVEVCHQCETPCLTAVVMGALTFCSDACWQVFDQHSGAYALRTLLARRAKKAFEIGQWAVFARPGSEEETQRMQGDTLQEYNALDAEIKERTSADDTARQAPWWRYSEAFK